MKRHLKHFQGNGFIDDEAGVAVTEYLVLLGLLLGGTLLAITVAAVSMSNAWDSWSNFYNSF